MEKWIWNDGTRVQSHDRHVIEYIIYIFINSADHYLVKDSHQLQYKTSQDFSWSLTNWGGGGSPFNCMETFTPCIFLAYFGDMFFSLIIWEHSVAASCCSYR
jgi:hypothetical protein